MTELVDIPLSNVAVVGLLLGFLAFEFWAVFKYLLNRKPSWTADYGCPLCDLYISSIWGNPGLTKAMRERREKRHGQLVAHWEIFHGPKVGKP